MPIGLALGGGAPNLPLMTGALLALDESDIDFKVITTTGAGMVVGLLYAAPQKDGPNEDWVTARRRALRATKDWGIDDLIYRQFPVNYKIFQKPGKLAEAYAHATNPLFYSIPRETRRDRLLGDILGFWITAMSPSSLGTQSKGLCQPPPWIELMVDFASLQENLEAGDKKFRLSAYCIDDLAERTFNKQEISVEHFKAALAMPFIYAPYHLTEEDGTRKAYLEGSAFKTLQLDPNEVMAENDVDTIIYFDVMGNKHLVGEPRWLVDAFGKSIVAPLTRLAEQDLELFKLKHEIHHLTHEVRALKHKHEPDAQGRLADSVRKEIDCSWKPHANPESEREPCDSFDRTEVLRMRFRDFIPEEQWPLALDWSHSNMSTLFDIGYLTGLSFVQEYGDRLRESMSRTEKPTGARAPAPRARKAR